MRPKGAEEGFEARVSWPVAVARFAGTVKSATDNRIQYYRQTDSRLITLSLSRQGLQLKPLVRAGDVVVANQVLAAVVSVIEQFPCSAAATQEYYIALLSSSSLGERYAAARALCRFPSRDTSRALLGKLGEGNEHIYARLEAAASLARHGEESGWSFLRQCLSDDYLQNRLEAVIVLAELPASVSCQLLSGVLLDMHQHPEIRAGAAWALGELRDGSARSVLIDSFSAADEEIRVEAARALAKLASRFTTDHRQVSSCRSS